MRLIHKYQANDGAEFDLEENCVKYEALCAEVSEVMSTLLPRPEDVDFSNGSGFLQHTPEQFFPAREAILRIGLRYVSNPPWLQKAIDEPNNVHPSYPGRLIDECCPTPVNRAWYRFMCTDKDLREWGQPYFANNPKQE